jgi:hypothetical protein
MLKASVISIASPLIRTVNEGQLPSEILAAWWKQVGKLTLICRTRHND